MEDEWLQTPLELLLALSILPLDEYRPPPNDPIPLRDKGKAIKRKPAVNERDQPGPSGTGGDGPRTRSSTGRSTGQAAHEGRGNRKGPRTRPRTDSGSRSRPGASPTTGVCNPSLCWTKFRDLMGSTAVESAYKRPCSGESLSHCSVWTRDGWNQSGPWCTWIYVSSPICSYPIFDNRSHRLPRLTRTLP